MTTHPPTPRPPLSRRSFVAVAGASAGAVVLGAAAPALWRSRADTATASAPVSTSTTSTTNSPRSTSTTGATTTTVAPSDTYGMGDVETDNLRIMVADGVRRITTASLPDHASDNSYRYAGTPSAQSLSFEVTTTPTVATSPTMVRTGQVVGVHLNSVVFDPTTAGYYGGRDSGWNENALSVDAYGAHTRPDGFYHYHSVTARWTNAPSTHGPLVGWAADGFPIYLRTGYSVADDPSSPVVALQPSYRLRSGTRPDGPGGAYDGTYVADYEYVPGLGDLDECNGRTCVTPEFPDGTYAYVLTDAWPSVPHWLRGTPDPSFAPGFGGGSGPVRSAPGA